MFMLILLLKLIQYFILEQVQTINGVNQFLQFNNKWYYFVKGFSEEYQYHQQELTKLVENINDFEEIKYLSNILDNFKLKYHE